MLIYLNKTAQGQKVTKHIAGGLTMVELLVVVSLLALIEISLFHTFSNGLKIWNRAVQTIEEEDAVLFFEKITGDLRNTLFYSSIRFEGKGAGVSIPTYVWTAPDRLKEGLGDDYHYEIGRVDYYLDAGKNLMRRQANYGQTLAGNAATPQRLMPKVHSLKFEYYYKSPEGYVKRDEAVNLIPSVVSVLIEFGDKPQRKMGKIIDIPIGS